VAAGHQVEWFAGSFSGGPHEEVFDGIRFVRRGRQWSVHYRAWRHYRGKLPGRFDVVIDQINTIPFFTPLWARIPVLMMIWQLAKEVWWYEIRFPLNFIGYALEPWYLRLYRGTPVVTFSASTATDLRDLGFRGNVTVAPVGVETAAIAAHPKGAVPTFVYVGRLAPSKRVDHIVKAFALFRRTERHGRLLLIGSGTAAYERRLAKLARRLGVGDDVELCGWLKGQEKQERVGEAHALLMASAREGWGLVVTESNSCGTPAIVYNVPGLRDSVRNDVTGLIVSPRPEHLAKAMIRVTSDSALYSRLVAEGRRWSKTLSFDETAQATALALARASAA
jgi:glycosyltransferase involved in cell wall biosynthesis